MASLDVWCCVALVPIGVVAAVLALCLDPYNRWETKFTAELEGRPPVPDDELDARYFEPGEAGPGVPARVRRVLARHLDFEPPADKLLPDDDVSFYWSEYNTNPAGLVRDLEREFGVGLPRSEVEALPAWTIRELSYLVTDLTREAARRR